MIIGQLRNYCLLHTTLRAIFKLYCDHYLYPPDIIRRSEPEKFYSFGMEFQLPKSSLYLLNHDCIQL